MSLFFFIYTTFILIVCVSVASICIATLVVTRQKRYVAEAAFFICYFLELVHIFGSEWLQQNISQIDASNYYAIDAPIFRIIIGAAILAAFWSVVLEKLDVDSLSTIALPTAAIIVAQAIILKVLPYGPIQQYLFYTCRQISLIACVIYCFVKVTTSKDEALKARMLKRKNIFFGLVALIFCILLEDSYIILVAPVPDAHSTFAGLFLSSRNFSENVMMLALAAHVVKSAIDQLSLRYFTPPGAPSQTDEEKEHIQAHIELRLPAFALKFSLSERERELVVFVLLGMSNKEIAHCLYLSEGTVKTHLHNIMKKCEVKNREELKQLFWAS